MYSASPDMRAALDAVRETDLALFARMRQPAWRLSTDMSVLSTRPDILEELAIMSYALGITERTSSRTGARLQVARVWVNPELTAAVSEGEDVPLRYVQATVIAHEFCHVIQPDMTRPGSMERDAFAAGDAFAARLPEPYAARMLAVSRQGAQDEIGGMPAMIYTGDYSRQPLPYGAGTTRGMTQRHYEALADVLRNALNAESGATQRATIVSVAGAIAMRLAAGNDRFRRQTFLNAVQDVARERVS